MAKPFDVATKAPRFALPLLTRQQIAGLMSDLDQDARSVVIIAIAELWQREIGEPDRDLAAEIDELKVKVQEIVAEGGVGV